MPSETVEAKIYKEICNYYEGLASFETLVEHCTSELESYPFYARVLNAVELGVMTNEDLHNKLSTNASDVVLRLKLLHLCGFRPREADDIFGRPGFFHGGGPKKMPTKLSVDDAVYVSAFLDVPMGYLLPNCSQNAAKLGEAWFNFAPVITDWRIWLKYNVDKSNNKRYLLSSAITLENSNSLLGLCIWRHEDLCHVSFTVEEPFNRFASEIQEHLLEVSSIMGWDLRNGIFTTSRQYLNTYGPIRIYSFTIWEHDNIKSRARLYMRTISPRNEEVTLVRRGDVILSIKYPWKKRIESIWSLTWNLA